MNSRLQKKCIVASTGVHLSLLIVLLFGSAFFSIDKKESDAPVLQMIPAILLDKNFTGGGEPDVKLPPPGPRPEMAQPPPPPPPKVENTPEPEQRNEEPPPPKPEIAKPAPNAFAIEKPKKAVPHVPKIDTTPKKATTGKKPSPTPTKNPTKNNNPTTDSQEREWAKARENLIKGTLASLSGTLSPGTKVGIPGAGGEAYAGYESAIQTIYQAEYNKQLASGGDVGERQAEVAVSVTLRRSGSVVTSSITRASGNAALNKLVQRVLDSVDFVAPFPKDSKDEQRTFSIVFDLKPKKALG
jgi:TonB family protein